MDINTSKVIVRDICRIMEEYAPLCLQESYDNAGLVIGNRDQVVRKILVSIDVTEAVVEEAIENQCEMIISHHPLIFRGLRKITGGSSVERAVINAIKHEVAIYASHTNLDKAYLGVSWKMAEKLDLTDLQVLSPIADGLLKLVTFVPESHWESLKKALFSAGAGTIGAYDSCSFSVLGTGTFRATESCHPYVGETGIEHFEKEMRLEVIVPDCRRNEVIEALLQEHPYEEPVYDFYKLSNDWPQVGLGVVGNLPEEREEWDVLQTIKQTFGCRCIRHTPLLGRKVRRIALCGGSGAEFLPMAIRSKAQIYVTADCKYHEFFNAEDQIILADIGHFESEQFTKELIVDCIKKKIPTFAFVFSKTNTNPINYL